MRLLQRIRAMPRALRILVLTDIGSVVALACIFCFMIVGGLYLPSP